MVDKKCEYLKDPYNFIDVFSALANMLLMIHHDFYRYQWFDYKTQQNLIVLAIAAVWFQAFYWMRLFDATAFFINLLAETFADIKAFVLMSLILLTAFANAFYVINLTDPSHAEPAEVSGQSSFGGDASRLRDLEE